MTATPTRAGFKDGPAGEASRIAVAIRKILHVDLDAFYASVEQRDDPNLRGRPVVVAWRGKRSVVCAASYEARKFGIRSAMPAVTAERLCPEAVFVPPDFTRYRAASNHVRTIFQRYSDIIEPLSLDEAYIDVTNPKIEINSATEIAARIRAEIYEEVRITASAGVASNKFLAKIASDLNKPNGQFVIRPKEIESFLNKLPVEKIPGVGKVTHERLAGMGIKTVGDLGLQSESNLRSQFGKYGRRLYELARGIDERPVDPNQPIRSISAEDTFEVDQPLSKTSEAIARLAAKSWDSVQKASLKGRTVTLKIKTSKFQILTRSQTLDHPFTSKIEVLKVAQQLRERLPETIGSVRLVGVGMSNFVDATENEVQAELFV